MIKEQKVKIKESKRAKTFNRLINDANHRLEDRLLPKDDLLKDSKNDKKTYKKEEWNYIYTSR